MFRHYINFKDKYPGKIEICEPAGFDAMEFKVEQADGRFGRDIWLASEEIPLTFYEGIAGSKTNQTLFLPNGISVDRLTSGYEWLAEFDKTDGFEANIEYILEKDGFEFIVGNFDFATRQKKIDGARYYEFNIIQNPKRAKIKRLEETNIDLFSDKDLDGNTITPAAADNILLKAKSVSQTSIWTKNNQIVHDALLPYSNFAVNITNYAVENSLTPFDNYPNIWGIQGAVNNFKYIRAKFDIANVKLQLKVKATFNYRTLNVDDSDNCTLAYDAIYYQEPYTFGDQTLYSNNLYRKTLSGSTNQIFEIDETFNFDLPDIPQSYCVALFWTLNFNRSTTGDENHRPFVVFNSLTQQLSGSSTAVNSVIKSVRYLDLFKQTVKSINGMNVIAPRYASGGAFWDNYAFTGKLIRQFSDQPFNITWKDVSKGLVELCADYQVNDDNVFITQYDGFYPNREIGVFTAIPANTFETEYNMRYQLVNFNYKYNNYEQDRDEKNTVDAVHTETQYKLPNDKVSGKKDIEVPHRRDPFGIESDRRQGISTKETTSLSGDDKLSMIDVIEVPAGTIGRVNQRLLMRVVDGKLQILNNDSEGNGIGFSWKLQGFKVGDVFRIVFGANQGTYIVDTLEATVLTLMPDAFTTPSFSGNGYIKCEFYLTDVQYTNRTNEGFTLIENLASGNNFSNLRYTIRRNMQHWLYYLATACKFKPTGSVTNTYFKSNGALKTQFENGQIFIENEAISVSSMPDPLITPMKYKIKVAANFADVVNLLSAMQQINGDEIGGFVRLLDADLQVIRGYISSLKYIWANETLELEVEQKFEPDVLAIETAVGANSKTLAINGHLYNISSYEVKVDRFEIFDQNKKKLYNKWQLSKISINGIIYDNEVDFCNALNLIL